MRNTITINEPTTSYDALPARVGLTDLSDLIEQRRHQRDEEFIAAADQRESDAKARAEQQMAQLCDVLRERLSEETYAALRLEYGFARNDDDQEQEHAYADFTYDDEVWTIQYLNGFWSLSGRSNGYNVNFDYGWHGKPFDSKLLDALDNSSVWLKEREQRQRSANAVTSLPTKRTIPHYTFTDGGDHSGYPYCGLLHTGAHVTVWVIPTDSGEYIKPHHTGRVESYDDRWLLLTCDGPTQQQRLIPVARIDEIVPEAPYAPETEPASKPALDEIPF